MEKHEKLLADFALRQRLQALRDWEAVLVYDFEKYQKELAHTSAELLKIKRSIREVEELVEKGKVNAD